MNNLVIEFSFSCNLKFKKIYTNDKFNFKSKALYATKYLTMLKIKLTCLSKSLKF